MKYVALLSGGKDSCYNLVHCSRNGHELVAAASLQPDIGKEELDSYLYQTVGQDAIEFVAQALDVPLYREVIRGTAIEQRSEYGGRTASDAGGIVGDETEDLHTLLSRVKNIHPEVEGVSVGAILSNYQRVRVEHVCSRLGLTVLCYLWQRNQAELLGEMIDIGMEAILIKVAGIGLTRSHLGKSLAQMQPTLLKLNALYGSHICGEGGEYETLTLDSPMFKYRIVLTDTEIVIHSDCDFATVAYLRIKGARLEPKAAAQINGLSVPPLLEDVYVAVREAVLKSQEECPSSTSPATVFLRYPVVPVCTSRQHGSWVSISNVQSPSSGSTLDEEVKHCFQLLIQRLAEHNLQLSDCAIINICISSIKMFHAVNAIYSTFFGPSPPARACVGVDLPEDSRVVLECIAFAGNESGTRQALHVQGLSYWAPANIGPYSQAINIGQRVFISGQIGLIPSQLAMPSTSFATEMALSCQHVSRIAAALKENTGGGWKGHTALNIYWLQDSADLPHARKGHLALQVPQSPTIFLQVKELPKGALVEKQVYLHTGRAKSTDEDGGEYLQDCTPLFEEDESKLDDNGLLRWELSRLEDDGAISLLIFLKTGHPLENWESHPIAPNLSLYLDYTLSTRYFYLPSGADLLGIYSNLIFGKSIPPITPIACRKISSLNEDTWDAAFCVVSALKEA